MPSISYAITISSEVDEPIDLIYFLHKNKQPQDEICVLLDKPKVHHWTLDQLYRFSSSNWIKLNESLFQNNFADWKNELNNMCSGDIIINLDADEIPSKTLIDNIHELIEINPEVKAFALPRVNTVENIGLSHVQKWGWSISKLESQINEKEFDLDNPQDLDEYNLLKQYNLIIEEY